MTCAQSSKSALSARDRATAETFVLLNRDADHGPKQLCQLRSRVIAQRKVRVVFAAIKVVGAFLLACASVIAAIVESEHPFLIGCLCAAFVVGIAGAEGYRAYRNHSVRSSIPN